MSRRGAAWTLVLVLATAGASAGTPGLVLDGPLVQGGLVIGRVAPGARVTVDGHAVRVSPAGRFLLGFGRDAPPGAVLGVTGPDGGTLTRDLAVRQRDYDIQRVDGLPPAKVTPSPEDLARIRGDNAAIAAVRRRDTADAFFVSGFAWPVRGRISGVYGSQRILNGKPRRPHGGVDVAAPPGTPVKAVADGIVALVRQDMFFTGKTLMIDHGHGLATVYAHMREITVREGARVAKGTPIGRVGASGRATGPHLHWGVSLFGTRLDPALLAGPMADGG